MKDDSSAEIIDRVTSSLEVEKERSGWVLEWADASGGQVKVEIPADALAIYTRGDSKAQAAASTGSAEENDRVVSEILKDALGIAPPPVEEFKSGKSWLPLAVSLLPAGVAAWMDEVPIAILLLFLPATVEYARGSKVPGILGLSLLPMAGLFVGSILGLLTVFIFSLFEPDPNRRNPIAALSAIALLGVCTYGVVSGAPFGASILFFGMCVATVVLMIYLWLHVSALFIAPLIMCAVAAGSLADGFTLLGPGLFAAALTLVFMPSIQKS